MRVICIESAKRVVEGGLYTVLEILDGQVFHWQGNTNYYRIEEDPITAYSVTLFIPLSNIDETEMKREYNHEPA